MVFRGAASLFLFLFFALVCGLKTESEFEIYMYETGYMRQLSLTCFNFQLYNHHQFYQLQSQKS